MQKASKCDYLSIDYFLDSSLVEKAARALHIRNRVSRIEDALKELSDITPIIIPITYPSGSKYLYILCSLEDVFASLRKDSIGIMLSLIHI